MRLPKPIVVRAPAEMGDETRALRRQATNDQQASGEPRMAVPAYSATLQSWT